MALFKVAADQRHLLDAQGRPFFVMGVNYAGHFDRAWRMWEDDLFDPALIERDFRKVRERVSTAFACLCTPRWKLICGTGILRS